MDQPETLRDEARIIAYWMSGSLRFAGDLAEDALFRMERQPDLAGEPDDPGDHGDSGCFGARRAWLLGYTARTCQDALADLPPRSLPAMLHPPADPSLPPAPAAESAAWLEPFPDELYPERYQERCHYEERSDEVISLLKAKTRLLRSFQSLAMTFSGVFQQPAKLKLWKYTTGGKYMPVEWIEHKDRKILYSDFSNIRKPEESIELLYVIEKNSGNPRIRSATC